MRISCNDTNGPLTFDLGAKYITLVFSYVVQISCYSNMKELDIVGVIKASMIIASLVESRTKAT